MKYWPFSQNVLIFQKHFQVWTQFELKLLIGTCIVYLCNYWYCNLTSLICHKVKTLALLVVEYVKKSNISDELIRKMLPTAKWWCHICWFYSQWKVRPNYTFLLLSSWLRQPQFRPCWGTLKARNSSLRPGTTPRCHITVK